MKAADLLDAWERGQARLPAERAVILLNVAGVPANTAASVPLGRRDALLLGLREQLFGRRLVAVVDCPGCGEPLETEFDTSAVRVDGEIRGEPLEVSTGGYRVVFRLPGTADVLAASQATGEDAAVVALLERCIERVEHDGTAVEMPVAELPAACRADVAVAMAGADPQAEIELALVCLSCGRRLQSLFDINAYLWREVAAWAERTLTEVHALARAYGWRESDVLAMSAFRRRRYLALVAQ